MWHQTPAITVILKSKASQCLQICKSSNRIHETLRTCFRKLILKIFWKTSSWISHQRTCQAKRALQGRTRSQVKRSSRTRSFRRDICSPPSLCLRSNSSITHITNSSAYSNKESFITWPSKATLVGKTLTIQGLISFKTLVVWCASLRTANSWIRMKARSENELQALPRIARARCQGVQDRRNNCRPNQSAVQRNSGRLSPRSRRLNFKIVIR